VLFARCPAGRKGCGGLIFRAAIFIDAAAIWTATNPPGQRTGRSSSATRRTRARSVASKP